MLEMFSQGTSSPGESVCTIWVIVACMEKGKSMHVNFLQEIFLLVMGSPLPCLGNHRSHMDHQDDELFSNNLHLLCSAGLLSQQQFHLYQLISH